MRICRLLVLACLLLIPGMALPIVIGSSNLPLMGYPEHDCTKPMRPTRPYDLSDKWAVDSYNRDVRQYNVDLEIFSQCIREYLESAANDIERIKEAAQKAVDDAQRRY